LLAINKQDTIKLSKIFQLLFRGIVKKHFNLSVKFLFFLSKWKTKSLGLKMPILCVSLDHVNLSNIVNIVILCLCIKNGTLTFVDEQSKDILNHQNCTSCCIPLYYAELYLEFWYRCYFGYSTSVESVPHWNTNKQFYKQLSAMLTLYVNKKKTKRRACNNL